MPYDNTYPISAAVSEQNRRVATKPPKPPKVRAKHEGADYGVQTTLQHRIDADKRSTYYALRSFGIPKSHARLALK